MSNTSNTHRSDAVSQFNRWHKLAADNDLQDRILAAASARSWEEAEILCNDWLQLVETKYGICSPQMATAYLDVTLVFEAQNKDSSNFRFLAQVITRVTGSSS